MITALLNQVLSRERKTKNSLGKTTASSVVSYDCRIESTAKSIVSQDGQQVQMSYRIYLKNTADVKVGDSIVFFETGVIGSGDSWTVKSIFHARGFSASHIEVYV